MYRPLNVSLNTLQHFLAHLIVLFIDIRKSDIDTLYFVQTTAIIFSVSGANNRDSGTSICFFLIK